MCADDDVLLRNRDQHYAGRVDVAYGGGSRDVGDDGTRVLSSRVRAPTAADSETWNGCVSALNVE